MTDLSKITTYQSGVTQAIAYRIVKRHTAHALRDFNLSCMQWFIVGTVLDAGKEGIRLSDLARKLDTTLAYMTTTINLLESRKILDKRAHQYDARTKLISVNPSYIKTCGEIESHVKNHLRKLLYKKILSEQLSNYINVLLIISDIK